MPESTSSEARSPEERTVLVLAATGTTGRQTVSALVRRGAKVRAATRRPEEATLPEEVEVVPFDLDDPDTWAPAMEGVDALYLALPPFRPDEVEEAEGVLMAAKDAGVQRVVKLSAMGVEHAPGSGHRQIELLVERSGMDWVHLRPTFFMDNLINFWGEGIAQQGVIAVPAGTGRAGFVSSSDIGEVAAEALLGHRSGEALPLTGPESLDYQTVATTLSEVIGRPVQYEDISPEDFRETMAAHGMPELGVEVMSGLYDSVRAGQTDGVSPAVREVLGREPVAMSQWARENAEAWQG